jgi:hypothetical protein
LRFFHLISFPAEPPINNFFKKTKLFSI